MRDLPDVNVLLALALPDHVHHDRASAWWTETRGYATTPITEMGVVRLLMQPAVVGAVVTYAAAVQALRSITADPRAEFIPDDQPILNTTGFAITGAKQLTDAHLTQLARKHRARLVTLDAKILTAADKDLATTIVTI